MATKVDVGMVDASGFNYMQGEVTHTFTLTHIYLPTVFIHGHVSLGKTNRHFQRDMHVHLHPEKQCTYSAHKCTNTCKDTWTLTNTQRQKQMHENITVLINTHTSTHIAHSH